MLRHVQLSFGQLRVSPSGFPRFVEPAREVEFEVLAFAATPSGCREFAALLDEPAEDTPERIVERVLHELASGRLEYDRGMPSGGGSAFGPRVENHDLAELATDDPEAELLHAVVIELADTEDRPIPGVAFDLVDPDGRTHSGHLDDEGRAEVGSIRSSGNCKVSFPEFDNRAWTYVAAYPL